MNRRSFIEKTALAAVGMSVPTIVPASVFGKNAPSNRITVGIIGTGRQGYGQNLQGTEQKAFGTKIPGLLDIADAQIVAACDVDSWRLNKAKETIEAHYAKNTSSGKYKACAIGRNRGRPAAWR